MYLNLINQISKLLNSDGDLMSNMNMVLIILLEYLPIRNPCLLIRDNVVNRYFIDLAPEISESEKSRWNKRAAKIAEIPILKLQHEMILYSDEPDFLKLPLPEGLGEGCSATIIQPVTYQRRHLPMCVFSLMVMDSSRLNEIEKIIRSITDILAISMIARGFPLLEIHDTDIDADPIPTIIDDIVGRSEKMKSIASVIKKISVSKTNVLICGESGTGKELIARAVHNNSLHRKAPFIGVNCAALSDSLLESELFGHERGAFTGALNTRKGRFELADGGTLFLDEIGDTSPGFQAKILRVLQEGQFERLGGNRTINVDVRVVCATNIDLEAAIQNGSFREDLFYRLNVIRFDIPALRDRREDIAPLARYFLKKLNQRFNNTIQILPEDIERLRTLNWPGNIRELENLIHSAFLMERDNYLNFSGKLKSSLVESGVAESVSPTSQHQETLSDRTLETEEIEMIKEALHESAGIQTKAARKLGISLRQLRYRIKKYDITVRKIRI